MENTIQRRERLLKVTRIVIVLASIILAFYFYKSFPERVPVHWNISGEVDNYASREFGAFFFPILLIVIYALFELIPKIDPRKERYIEFAKVYSIFKTVLMLVFLAIYIISSLNGLGYSVSVAFWIPLMIGLLFIVLGNYFGKLRSNYFVGIRVPWTLANEEVWNKTHRLGGKLFILGGIIMMLMGYYPVTARLPLFILILIIVLVLPILYSYFLYKKIKKL